MPETIFKNVAPNEVMHHKCGGPHKFGPEWLMGDGKKLLIYHCKLCVCKLLQDEYTWYIRGLNHGRLRR